MKAPLAMFNELLSLVHRDLYRGKSDKAWFAQRRLVKKALLYPARWLDERQVPITSDRYRAIVEGIVATMVAHGRLEEVSYMGRYLLTCVQKHMEAHGDAYYQEGKAIRNRVGVFMAKLDTTVATLAQEARELLAVNKSPDNAPALVLQADLLPVALGGSRRIDGPVAPRKMRSDALHYKLSPERRVALRGEIDRGMSYRQAIALCASWGVKTSLGGIAEYLKGKAETL